MTPTRKKADAEQNGQPPVIEKPEVWSLIIDANEIELLANMLANGQFQAPMAKHVAANLQVKIVQLAGEGVT